MKICFIQSGLSGGGAERKVCNLANYFVSKGHTVSIGLYGNNDIAFDLDKRISVDFIGFLNNQKLKSLFILFFIFKPIVKLFCKIFKINYAEIRNNYINNYNENNIISFIKERDDYVFISMGSWNYCYIINLINKNNLDYIKDRYIVNECSVPYITGDSNLRDKYYSLAKKLVVINEGMKNCFSENIQSNTLIISNPIKKDLPEPYFGERNKTIVAYSRFSPEKNLPLLINAFAKLSEKYTDYKLEIYGQGPLKNDLIKQIKDLNLNHKAFIYNFDPNVQDKIKKSAMYILTSDYDANPNSLLEALAIGLPAISTDCDFGPRYMIKDHENGLLVPCNDVDALYNAMVEYIENPQLAIKCGREAVKVREKYSIEKIGNMWLELIENVDKNH